MEWINNKIRCLEKMYGKEAYQWKNESDDRKLYSNIFFIWISALRDLQTDPANIIRVAINDAITADMERLDRIKSRFAYAE